MESLLKKGVLSDKAKFYTFSIASLAGGENFTMVRMLSNSDQRIRKENIDSLIEKCLSGKFSQKPQKSNIEDEAVKPSEAKNRRKQMMETEAILESFRQHPMLSSTTYISPMILLLPRIRDLQAQKIEINNVVLKDALNMFCDRWKLSQGLEKKYIDYSAQNGYFELRPIKSNTLPSIECEKTEKEKKYTERKDIDTAHCMQKNMEDMSAGFSGVQDLTAGNKTTCLIRKLEKVEISDQSSDNVHENED